MHFPTLPNEHAIAILLLTVVALFLFTRENIPLETSSLLIITGLAAALELFPYRHQGSELHAIDLFSGFGHEALIAVCALMIAGQGLVRTGALEPVGRRLSIISRYSPMLLLLITLLIGAVLSAFVNNTPVVILLMPILISATLRTNRSPSSILMPMGFATLVGGMCTTIGTSTNLLVVSVAADLGLEAFGMFDFLLPGSIAAGVGIVYLWLIAPRLLPERETPLSDTSPRLFFAQFSVPNESKSVGKSLAELIAITSGAIKIVQIQRQDGSTLTTLPDITIKAGDRLTVCDTPKQLKEYEQVLNITLQQDSDTESEENTSSQQLAEVVVSQGSPLENTTLRKAHFQLYYRLMPLAIHHAGKTINKLKGQLDDIHLHTGDVLLVQGESTEISTLKRSGELLVLDSTEDLPHSRKAPIALIIMLAIIIIAGFGILPIAISALCGVLAMLITGCLDWKAAVQALSTPVILIVVASLALGSAMVATGGADYIANVFLFFTYGASGQIILSGLMLTMALLTNVISNNAAAVIGTPIAISMASQLNLPAIPFVLAVLFGANMSYITPMAYKTNLLVMNAGGYKFKDFVKVGIPLTILMWLVLSWLLPTLYQF